MPTDFNVIAAQLETLGKSCTDMLNEAKPVRSARWIAGGTSCRFDIAEGHVGATFDVDAHHKHGKIYLRVRVTPHAVGLSVAQLADFQKFLDTMASLARRLEAVIEEHSFGEAQVTL